MAETTSTGDQYTEAVGQLRTTAQWLVTAAAGVGAVIVAGLQLKSIGGLTDLRLVGAVAGALIGIACVAAAIWAISEVLMPVGASPTDIAKGDDFKPLRDRVATDNGLLRGEGADLSGLLQNYEEAGAKAREEYDALIKDPTKNQAVYKAALARFGQVAAVLTDIQGLGIYLRATERFKFARLVMGLAAFGATGAAALFAYCANPPKTSKPASPVAANVTAARVVHVRLSAAGRETLEREFGARCDLKRLRAAVIGGTPSKPELVTLPRAGCRARKLTLDATLGVTAAG